MTTPERAATHVVQLVHSRHVLATVHGAGALGRINTWLAVRITRLVGTMWAAYLFTILALVALPAAVATGQPLIIVAWIAQTFLQLVLLPIIIVGQNVNQAAADARAEADHQTLTAIHTLTAHVDQLSASIAAVVTGPDPAT